ncbi:MAG: hypothetical protein U1F43_00555 [Myxococcota bacterium]
MRSFAFVACSWGAIVAGVGCDSGSSIDAVDWRSVSSRLSVLEAENADLKAQLADAVLADDLAAYATKAEVADCAHLDDLPDLAPYALKSELPNLAPYALTASLPDFALYALKSELPNLAPYALKTELPNLSLYALKTELPNLSLYALKTELALYALKADVPPAPDLSGYVLAEDLPDFNTFARVSQLPDLTPYATDADLAALDTRLDTDLDPLTHEAVRILRADKVVRIPEDFATFDAAMQWADGFSIAQGYTLTFQFAPSATPYVFTKPMITSGHRDGGRVQILGDVTDASKVVLQFPQSGAISLRYGRIGLIDGITFRGGFDSTNPSSTPAPAGDPNPSGITAAATASIFLGKEVVVEKFWRSGVRATQNGSISAEGVIARNNGEDGFAAIDGGFIYVQDALAQGNLRHGYNAAINGAIEGNRLTATENGQIGVNAFMGSAVMSNFGTSGVGGFATSTNNGWHGFSATGASGMSLPWAVATGNGKNPAFGAGQGFVASNGAGIDANHATSKSNTGSGFGSFTGGAINAQFTTAESNKQNGYSSNNASAIDALAALALTNDQNGFGASLGGAIQANRFTGTPAQSAIARQNKQNGFASFTGGAIDATMGLSEDNLATGVLSNGNSIVTASGVTVDGNNGDGLSSWMGGAIIAGPAFQGATAVPTSIKDTGGYAVASNMGSTIFVDQAKVTMRAVTPGNGVSAWESSTISAQNVDISGAAFNTFAAYLGSTVNANGSHGSASDGACFSAAIGASISADNSSATDCAGGYDAWAGSAIHAMYGKAVNSRNGGYGFYVHGNSSVNGAMLTATGGSGNGIDVSIGSAVWAPGLEVSDNAGYGIQVAHASTLLTHVWSENGVDTAPLATGNYGGVSVHDGSYVTMPDGVIAGSDTWDAVNVNTHSGLAIDDGAITGSTGTSQNAAGVYNLSWLSAQRALVDDNAGGINCGGSSVCDLQNATVTNSGPGVGAFWNAFVMVSNTFASAFQPAAMNDQFQSGNFGTPRPTP